MNPSRFKLTSFDNKIHSDHTVLSRRGEVLSVDRAHLYQHTIANGATVQASPTVFLVGRLESAALPGAAGHKGRHEPAYPVKLGREEIAQRIHAAVTECTGNLDIVQLSHLRM